MTGDPLPLANRVRKARRASVLSCGHHVNIGHIIVQRQGKWLCIECCLQAIRAARKATAP